MTEYDAIECAAGCKGQYPRMTTEQVDGVRVQVRHFNRGAAERALQDMVRDVQDWNTHQYLAIVKRHQLEINDEQQAAANKTRWQSSHSLKQSYDDAERAAAGTSDDELKSIRDEMYVRYPHLREIYGDVDPRKRRSLLLMIFYPAVGKPWEIPEGYRPPNREVAA